MTMSNNLEAASVGGGINFRLHFTEAKFLEVNKAD